MTVDVVEVLVTPDPVVVELESTITDVVEILVEGPPGPPGSGVAAAEGTVSDVAEVWVMQHHLGYHPGGWRFRNGVTGEPMQPIRVVDVSDQIATAEWLPPGVRGDWIAS